MIYGDYCFGHPSCPLPSEEMAKRLEERKQRNLEQIVYLRKAIDQIEEWVKNEYVYVVVPAGMKRPLIPLTPVLYEHIPVTLAGKFLKNVWEVTSPAVIGALERAIQCKRLILDHSPTLEQLKAGRWSD